MNTTTIIKDESVYWEAQVRAIGRLRNIGVHYGLNDRIEPMKCLKFISKLRLSEEAQSVEAKDALVEAEKALGVLVYLRINGVEPPHINNRYK